MPRLKALAGFLQFAGVSKKRDDHLFYQMECKKCRTGLAVASDPSNMVPFGWMLPGGFYTSPRVHLIGTATSAAPYSAVVGCR